MSQKIHLSWKIDHVLRPNGAVSTHRFERCQTQRNNNSNDDSHILHQSFVQNHKRRSETFAGHLQCNNLDPVAIVCIESQPRTILDYAFGKIARQKYFHRQCDGGKYVGDNRRI